MQANPICPFLSFEPGGPIGRMLRIESNLRVG